MSRLALLSVLACTSLAACDADSPTWPVDEVSLFSITFTDGTGDLAALPTAWEAPSYSGLVSYPPVDVERIRLGVQDDYLYMRVDFVAPIPDEPVHIPRSGEVEEQWVRNQGMNVALNTDGNRETGGGGEGVKGIDIFFAIALEYGSRIEVYANYDFPTPDVHLNQSQIEGELGDGGPGHDFVLVRYDISGLGAYLPRSVPLEVGSWSEAESYDSDGTLKYHHFAFDRVIDGGIWTIPAG